MSTELVKSTGNVPVASGSARTMDALLAKMDPNDLALGVGQMMGLDTKEQGLVVVMACAAQRQDPVTFMTRNHIIKGRISKKAHTQLADLRRAGWDHEMVEKSPKRAAIVLKSPKGKEYSFEFTWEEAKESRTPWVVNKKTGKKELKENWSTPFDRKKMLWARLVSDAVDTVAPEISGGVPAPEELDDYVEPADGPDGHQEQPEADDAEFEVKEDPEKEAESETEPETEKEPEAEESSQEESSEEDEPQQSEPVDPDKTLPGKCTKAQRAVLKQLIQQAKDEGLIDDSVVERAMRDRGVTQMNQLDKQQIDEMSENLEGLLGN